MYKIITNHFKNFKVFYDTYTKLSNPDKIFVKTNNFIGRLPVGDYDEDVDHIDSEDYKLYVRNINLRDGPAYEVLYKYNGKYYGVYYRNNSIIYESVYDHEVHCNFYDKNKLLIGRRGNFYIRQYHYPNGNVRCLLHYESCGDESKLYTDYFEWFENIMTEYVTESLLLSRASWNTSNNNDIDEDDTDDEEIMINNPIILMDNNTTMTNNTEYDITNDINLGSFRHHTVYYYSNGNILSEEFGLAINGRVYVGYYNTDNNPISTIIVYFYHNNIVIINFDIEGNIKNILKYLPNENLAGKTGNTKIVYKNDEYCYDYDDDYGQNDKTFNFTKYNGNIRYEGSKNINSHLLHGYLSKYIDDQLVEKTYYCQGIPVYETEYLEDAVKRERHMDY